MTEHELIAKIYKITTKLGKLVQNIWIFKYLTIKNGLNNAEAENGPMLNNAEAEVESERCL